MSAVRLSLVAVLNKKQIVGAALDVRESEPMTSDNALRAFDEVRVTSNLAGQRVEAR